MQKALSLLLFLSSVFVFVFQTEAQVVKMRKEPADSLSTDSTDSKRSLTVEMDAGTNRGYQARRRTISPSSNNQRYIEPNINYEAESGFYTSVALYKTPGVKRSWDEFDYGLGWDFSLSKEADIDGSIGYTRFIYNSGIKQVINPSTNDLEAYEKHDFDVIAFKLTEDYYFGNVSDADLIADIDHDFYIEIPRARGPKTNELSIDPTFTMIGGTLNYYKGNVQVPPLPPDATRKAIEKAEEARMAIVNFPYDQFTLNDYELALPINYEVRRVDMEIALRYSIPSNLPAALNAKSFAYVTAYISYDFLK